ncbi:MAG: hypothetical protein AAB410_03820 [Patescibacteria group bacterium]
METITITKKEYEALVFAKRQSKPGTKKSLDIWDKSFGILKNSFGKGSSVNIVRKMRKDWR